MSKLINVNMASDADDFDFDKNIENIKDTVKKSFAQIYAALKARELKTLRQLDAIRKQCEDDKNLKRNCVQDLHLSFGNEANLLENIYNYGAIDFERIKLDSKIFTLEDYVSPENDHMYLYKTIEELTKAEPDFEIEEAALKQITSTEGCVCYVDIRPEDVARQFRDPPLSPIKAPLEDSLSKKEKVDCTNFIDEDKSMDEKSMSSGSDVDVKKIEPTDEWLNSIKSQTETEPSQITDVMEHSTITCT